MVPGRWLYMNGRIYGTVFMMNFPWKMKNISMQPTAENLSQQNAQTLYQVKLQQPIKPRVWLIVIDMMIQSISIPVIMTWLRHSLMWYRLWLTGYWYNQRTGETWCDVKDNMLDEDCRFQDEHTQSGKYASLMYKQFLDNVSYFV